MAEDKVQRAIDKAEGEPGHQGSINEGADSTPEYREYQRLSNQIAGDKDSPFYHANTELAEKVESPTADGGAAHPLDLEPVTGDDEREKAAAARGGNVTERPAKAAPKAAAGPTGPTGDKRT
jgi:hypothetical protein